MSLPTKPQTRAGMPPRRARVLLGAAAKVGKTETLGAWAPATTLIVDTQNGTLLLDGEHYVEHVRDWPGFVRVVNDVCAGGHMFHTIGLDLVNDLWRFCDLHHGKPADSIPASGTDDYGRSLAKARSAFLGTIGRLLAAPVGIWFLTHLAEKTDKTGELVMYVPKLDKQIYGEIAGAVDFLWLAEALPNGRRVVHTQPTKHFDEAGSRRRVPSPLPLDVGDIARAMDRALNPQDYDADGNRVAQEVPASSEVPPTPPRIHRDVAESDIPSDIPAAGAAPETAVTVAHTSLHGLLKALVADKVMTPEQVTERIEAAGAVNITSLRHGIEQLTEEQAVALHEEISSPTRDQPASPAAAPGSVAMPDLDGLSPARKVAALKEAGCICVRPLQGHVDGNPDCPLVDHGLPFDAQREAA